MSVIRDIQKDLVEDINYLTNSSGLEYFANITPAYLINRFSF